MAGGKGGRFKVRTKPLLVFPRVLFYPVACLALVWPALLSGFPILFPDTMNYVASGDPIVAALLGRPTGSYGTRSVFFSLSLFPLHYLSGPWPIILVQAMLGAWTLRTSLRLLWGEDRPRETLGVVLVLSGLSSLPWTVSLIMPDYLCGLMILWLFLLCSKRSSRTVKFLSAAFTWYAAVSHASHLALLLALAPISVVVFPRKRRALQSTLSVSLLTVLSLLAFHGFLFGRPLLFGQEGPPFLTARLLADGTGVRMLEKHDHFTVAHYEHLFSSDSDEILWGPGGLGEGVRIQNFKDWKAIKTEERRFVLATLRHDPLLQLRCSLKNWWTQCLTLRVELSRGSAYLEREVKRLWPNQQDSYFNSLQNTAELPPLVHQLHLFSLVLALLSLLVLGTQYRKQIGASWLQLGVLVGSSYLINAAITGILSKPTGRYQSRIAWLICFTALAAGYQVFQDRKRLSKSVDVVRG